jgi:hypothetical protein
MLPEFPGLASTPAILFDERARPDFRDVFGTLARQATDIATAVTRVRLSTLDLQPDEVEKGADPQRSPRVGLLRELLESGRLEVRSAPLGGWSPDFTVFSEPEGPVAVLAGFHWFERPYPHRGPALGMLHFQDAARSAARRHAELWARAHDVGPAVWSILSKAERGVSLLRVQPG